MSQVNRDKNKRYHKSILLSGYKHNKIILVFVIVIVIAVVVSTVLLSTFQSAQAQTIFPTQQTGILSQQQKQQEEFLTYNDPDTGISFKYPILGLLHREAIF